MILTHLDDKCLGSSRWDGLEERLVGDAPVPQELAVVLQGAAGDRAGERLGAQPLLGLHHQLLDPAKFLGVPVEWRLREVYPISAAGQVMSAEAASLGIAQRRLQSRRYGGDILVVIYWVVIYWVVKYWW